MTKGNRIAKAAALIMIVTLAGRFLGFIREMLTARHFPVELVDSYVVAYTLPNIFGITMTGAFMAAFIPTFTQLMEQGDRERAWRLALTVFNAVVLLFAVLVGLGMVFAPTVVDWIAPGFANERSPETVHLTVELMRIMFPTLLFASVGGITMGVLNSLDHFLMPSLGPLAASLTVVAAILFVSPSMGIYALAAGTLVGLFLQTAVQIPAMIKKGFRYRWLLDLNDPLVRQVGVLVIPVLIGVGIGQVNILIDRNLASGLPAGSVSMLNFANQVYQLPMGIIVQAISVPIFPAFSALAAQKDMPGLHRTVGRGTNYYSLLLIPMTAGLMVLAVPTTRIIFERGAFTPENTVGTAVALFWYALGLLPAGMRDLYTRVFYALQDTKTPVKIGALCVGVHIALNLALIDSMGHGGLALATSLSALLNMVILGWILYRRTGGWNVGSQLIIGAKALVASLVMAAVVWEVNQYLQLWLGARRGILELLSLSGSIATGVVVYGVMIWLLRIDEVGLLLDMVKAKWRARFGGAA